MKKIKLIAFALVGVSLLSSCSKTFFNNNNNNNPNNDIILGNGHDFESRNNYKLKPISGYIIGAENQENKDSHEVYDSTGKLLIPFDIAYPEFMDQTKYDANSILVKIENSKIESLLKTLNIYNVTGYSFVSKVDDSISWFKLMLDGIASNEIINTFRSLNTQALQFDLNYVFDESSLQVSENYNTTSYISTQNSDDTTVENWGIPGSSKNTYFKNQYYFKDLGLKDTYEHLKKEGLNEGGKGIVVAVIDTGVDYKHEDLKGNIWHNSGEIEGNGIDDDSNGFVDDIRGWNFVDNTNDPYDDQGHGTHVAGIIAAQNNDKGTLGIAYNSDIMILKAGDGSGYFTQDRIAQSITYAYMNGADIINMSFGGESVSIAVLDALEAAYTTAVLVAAAGNEGNNNEIFPIYPASLSHVLGVMSVDSNYCFSSFSNFDTRRFNSREYEICAPGEQIYSTIPGNRYASLSGTSMAAPIISGIIALLKTKYFDPNVYPTKYFMGQIACASDKEAKNYPDLNYPRYVVNAYDSCVKSAKPEVNLKEYYIFDNKEYSDVNNNDGVMDAGETIYLAPVLSNYWGKSTDTIISFDTKSSISGEESKYVSISNEIISFGDIGTYSDKNYLTISSDGQYYTGADLSKCLKIEVLNDIPNNVTISFNFTVTYKNGLEINDTTLYSTKKQTIYITASKGEIIPKLIKEDTTLTSDKLWIVDELVQVLGGVTLSVEPGTTIQFGNNKKNKLYGEQKNSPTIEVYGTFNAIGTKYEPIQFTHSNEQYNNSIYISNKTNSSTSGISNFTYCNFDGNVAYLFITSIMYCKLNADIYSYHDRFDGFGSGVTLRVSSIEKSKLNFINTGTYIPHPVNFNANYITNSVITFDNSLATGFNWIHSNDVYVDEFINTTFIAINMRIVLKLSEPETPVYANYRAGKNGYGISNPYFNYLSVNLEGVEEAKIINYLYDVYKELEHNKIQLRTNPFEISQGIDNSSFSFNSDIDYFYFYFDGNFVHSIDRKQKYTLKEFIDNCKRSGIYYDSIFYNYDDNNYGVRQDFSEYLIIQLSLNDNYSTQINDMKSYHYNFTIIDGTTFYETSDGDNYFSNVMSVDELKITTKTAEIFSVVSVKNELGIGGSFNSENINLLSDSIGDYFQINTYENSVFSSYLYENLFIFNTTNEELLDYIINDGNDLAYHPTISTEHNGQGIEELWPYVTKLEMLNSSGNPSNVFGNEDITVKLHFNREMDTEIPVRLRFGSYGPAADYEINGDYIDKKTWVGEYTLTTLIESGTQYFNISGGAALTDDFMDIQEPTGRFKFVIDTTSALSKNITGLAQDDGILLSWFQDDYGLDTIMGYNIYRSNEENGNYVKVNSSIVSKEETEFLDTGVEPGETYWYTFVIVLTDLTESSPAAKISIKAKDTMSPNIYHSPVYETYTGSKLTISCQISDNIGVENAYLYYRTVGQTTYKKILMNSSNNRFTASIASTELSTDGLEYYIEASDGTNIVSKGTAENPFVVIVKDGEVLSGIGDVDGDGEITVKDAYLILQHVYGEIILTGEQFLRADLNGDGILSTSEAYRILQYINGNVSTLEF